MDKKFVNIDALVRQRLDGGEENERPGAWLQMRSLLDKEMPQKRVGFIFWRNMLGAVAVLLALTTAGVGGYMYTNVKNNTSGANDNVNVNANNNNNTPANNNNAPDAIANNSGVTSSKQISSSNNTENKNKITKANTHSYTQNNTRTATSTVASIVKHTAGAQSLTSNNTTTNNKTQIKKQHIEKNRRFINNLTALNERNKQQEATRQEIAAKSHQDTDNKLVLASNKSISGNGPAKQHILTTAEAQMNPTGAGQTNSLHITHVARKTKNSVNGAAIAGNTNTKDKKVAGHSINTNKKRITNTTTLAVANSRATASKTINHTGRAADKKNDNHNINKLALGSGTSATKRISGIKGAKAINTNKQSLKNNTAPANNKAMASIAGSSNNTKNSFTASNSTKQRAYAKNVTAPVISTANKEATPAPVPLMKKIMDRLVMTERFVKTAPNEGYFKLDTISMESVSEELGLNTANNPTEPNLPNSARKTTGTNTVNTAGIPVGSNANGTNTATASNAPAGSNTATPGSNTATSGSATSASAAIIPGSSMSSSSTSSGKSGTSAKENQASGKGNGALSPQKLSETFNDIKYHVSGAQFAPGLTAGINATFFGPNSFKGFQFGVTGNIIFGDNLSILGELKYFHRINNDYTLNDNYYAYTPAGGGMYNKTLVPSSYSFSTLHSIEMPVSIRYCKSHFNFFVGGNIVYSFAINTGAYTPPVSNNNPPTVTLVPAPGNDNAPKIKNGDFDSRFGLGYLLGISYQVSPSVMLDFRNVQTVWDNASTPGAKFISNQLYKSPSFQVSFGYRLGANKKNKD